MSISGKLKELRLGQRLMIGFQGPVLSRELKHLIAEFGPAGVILFASNLDSPSQIASLCRDIQRYAHDMGIPPMLVAIDQEGGIVRRLKPPFTQFAGNPAIQSEKDAVEFARVTARELKSVGINMNMAPVMDVVEEGRTSIMYERVFRGNCKTVARMGTLVIDKLQEAGVMAVAKHFPGIGRTVLDSHMDLPTLDISREELWTCDLVPFIRAVEHNVAGIMLSHIIYSRIDGNWPASLSPEIADRLLRRKIGYNGIIMTDDLDMGAIKKHFPIELAISQVVRADIDLALICHQGPSIEKAYATLAETIGEDSELERRHRACIDRISNTKTKFGLTGKPE